MMKFKSGAALEAGSKNRLLMKGALLCTLLGAAQANAAAPPPPLMSGQWVRCAETAWAGSACGGDDLAMGRFTVLAGGVVTTRVEGALADPFNLYEVYWLPIGAQVTSATLVGNFATDCNGAAATPLKLISTPAQVLAGAPVNVMSLTGTTAAGHFLVYSRGPWGFDDANADCLPDTLNSTSKVAPLANPQVDLATSGVQFISGFQQ